MRLQRVLAAAGVASRRDCEDLIRAGRVRVNGRPVRDLPCFVDPARDRIAVNGTPLSTPDRPVYLMFHKPARSLVSAADQPGSTRRTLAHFVSHPAAARLFPVGRLDFDATGLVLLTNDGDFAHRLTHPSSALPRTYRVAVKGAVDPALLSKLSAALLRPVRRAGAARPAAPSAPSAQSPGRDTSPVRLVSDDPARPVIEFTISRGRTPDIRTIMARLGLHVRRLTRTAIGPLELSAVAPGHWRELTRDELRALRRALRAHAPARTRRSPARAPDQPTPQRPDSPAPSSDSRPLRRVTPHPPPSDITPGPAAPAHPPRDAASPLIRRRRPHPAPSHA